MATSSSSSSSPTAPASSASKAIKSKKNLIRSIFPRGCRSQSFAFDSLPRNPKDNQAAIHRLGVRNVFTSNVSNPSTSQTAATTTATALPNIEPLGSLQDGQDSSGNNKNGNVTFATRSKSVSRQASNRFKRSFSLRRSTSSGTSRSLAKRAPPVSSSDLPPISSDVENQVQHQNTQAKTSDVACPKIRARYQSLPSHALDQLETLNPTSHQTSPGSSEPIPANHVVPRLSLPTATFNSARKRVLVKSMISKPTNFQHSGHIGINPCDTLVSRAPNTPSSQMAAALNTNQVGLVPTTATVSIPPSVPMALSSNQTTPQVTPSAPSIHGSTNSRPSSPAPHPNLIALPTMLPSMTTLNPSRPSSPSTISSRPSSPSRISPRPTSPLARVDACPMPHAETSGSPKAPLSTLHDPLQSNSPLPGAGKAKRKPVPKVLAELEFEADHIQRASRRDNSSSEQAAQPPPTVAALPDLSSSLSTCAHTETLPVSQLEREASVIGPLPNERDFAVFVSNASRARRRGTRKDGVDGTATQQRLLTTASSDETSVQMGQATLKRWGLAESFAELAQGTVVVEGHQNDLVTPPKKNMVQGPAGVLITDTANLRWNSAMDEIRKALAEDDPIDTEQDDGIQQAMKQADQVLGRLGVENPLQEETSCH